MRYKLYVIEASTRGRYVTYSGKVHRSKTSAAMEATEAELQYKKYLKNPNMRKTIGKKYKFEVRSVRESKPIWSLLGQGQSPLLSRRGT